MAFVRALTARSLPSDASAGQIFRHLQSSSQEAIVSSERPWTVNRECDPASHNLTQGEAYESWLSPMHGV
eukprot:s3167_g1.t1